MLGRNRIQQHIPVEYENKGLNTRNLMLQVCFIAVPANGQ